MVQIQVTRGFFVKFSFLIIHQNYPPLLRHFFVLICFILTFIPLQGQVSVARWQMKEGGVYAGESFPLRLRIFLSGERDAVFSPSDDMLDRVRQHLFSLGFIIAVENDSLVPQIEGNEKVLSSLVWEGAVFHPDPGTYTLSKGLEDKLRIGPDSASLDREIPLRFLPLSIEVLALPESQLPESWSIGSFSMEHRLNKGSYLTGELILLDISIQGRGGLSSISAPRLPYIREFLVYDPQSELDIKILENSVVGKKTFHYSLTAAYEGDYALGPVRFYYFDPGLQAYDSLRIDRITIRVRGKDIPQLVDVNALDNFYRDAFSRASDERKLPFKYASIIIWSSTGMIILLLLYGFLREIIRKRQRS